MTDKGNTKIVTVVIEGDYLRALIRYAFQFGVDLVVMPASARPGIRQFMFGTNTQSVFAAISCPVLTYQAAEVPAVNRRIILPVEDDYPINKLHYATILSKLTGADIHLVCLRHKLHSLQKNTFAALFRISEQLDLTGIRYKIYAADGKNLTDVMLHYAEREQIDLILVNPREQSEATEKCIEYLGSQIGDYTKVSA
jgi:nucleotide-binding universal stress UspA family protein